MNLAQVVIMGYTLVAVGALGDSLKHRRQAHYPLFWWVYGVMVVVFLVCYWVVGRI